MPKLSKPTLPATLIKNTLLHPALAGFKSTVFTPQAHDDRVQLRHGVNPDFIIHSPTDPAHRTALHLAASSGDVLAVYEILWMGATADIKDAAGITSLHLVLHCMRALAHTFIPVRLGSFDLSQLCKDREDLTVRLAWIARILIEQHAEVNQNNPINDVSLLYLACDAQSWETVSILLAHGARIEAKIMDHLRAADKTKLAALTESCGKFDCRPPRICPCWSGLTVSQCHGKEDKPYPLDYLCWCGSPKHLSFERCCYPRAIFASETWDEITGRICRYFIPAGYDTDLGRAVRNWQNRATKMTRETEDQHFETLLALDAMDPAFAYAMKTLRRSPQPVNRQQYNRTVAQTEKHQWNAVVDNYIAEGQDKRSRKEIEKAAKIDLWKGAWVKVCKGANCDKTFRDQVDKFSVCAKCKIATYCGAECQRSAWRTHKVLCNSEAFWARQMLPSQKAVAKYMLLGLLGAGTTQQDSSHWTALRSDLQARSERLERLGHSRATNHGRQ